MTDKEKIIWLSVIGIITAILIILYSVWLYFQYKNSTGPFKPYVLNPSETTGLYVKNKEDYILPLSEETKTKKLNMLQNANNNVGYSTPFS